MKSEERNNVMFNLIFKIFDKVEYKENRVLISIEEVIILSYFDLINEWEKDFLFNIGSKDPTQLSDRQYNKKHIILVRLISRMQEIEEAQNEI